VQQAISVGLCCVGVEVMYGTACVCGGVEGGCARVAREGLQEVPGSWLDCADKGDDSMKMCVTTSADALDPVFLLRLSMCKESELEQRISSMVG
jgi:hypothetical protein